MADVLIRKSRDNIGTQTHKEEGHVMRKKEIKVIYLQAKEHQGLPAQPQARRAWKRFVLRANRRNQACQHLDFGLVASRTVRQ